ncbi:MAG: LacI family transcriptional regulator [Lachnospiraceae bacterium]|nr:LacI family transcriptional regulator [Lachnospiraceae bacterium]
MTIYDISEKSGVSIATVSRVLNGAKNVNPDTRERVEAVMSEMGYKPNAFARGLGLDTMKTIGILCADSSDTYLAKAVYFIEEQLRRNNYDSLLCCTGYESSNKKKALDLLISKKVDAAILVGSNFLEPSRQGNKYIRNAAASVPIMLLNAFYDYPNVYSVYCDDAGAMEQATDLLLDSGCRNILYLYDSRSYSGQQKIAGFTRSYGKHKIDFSPDQLQFCPCGREDIAGSIEFITSLWDKGMRFDGVLASEDALAVAALKFASAHDLAVPDDIRIIGYNNSFLATMTIPELTSVDNKLQPMCRQLVDTLLNVLSGHEMPVRSEYSGEIISRETA